MFLCPVRECPMPLVRDSKRLFCTNGHSFDVARSGYINLLQPQDRRSKDPGDTASAVAARRRLHERGLTRKHLEAIAKMIHPSSEDVVLDAGCGDGFYLGTLAKKLGFDAHGLDISIPAVNTAARTYPECHWIVANADRFIPYAPGSFSIVLSITARMNSSEFRRILHRNGHLLVAIPGPSDFIELRSSGRDRVPQTIEAFAPDFHLVNQQSVTTESDLDAYAVQDVLLSIYRPMQPQPKPAMRVTFSLDLLLFSPNSP